MEDGLIVVLSGVSEIDSPRLPQIGPDVRLSIAEVDLKDHQLIIREMEVLNLSQSVVQTLSREIDKLSPEQLVKICRVFLQRLVLGNNVGGNLDERTLSVLEAVGSVLLDAAKTRTTEGQLRYV